MKFIFILLTVSYFFSCAEPPVKNLKSLEERLAGLQQTFKAKNFDGMMEYLYPEIFKLATKSELKKALASTYADAEDASISIDSLITRKISDEFQFKGNTYRQISSDMTLLVKYKDSVMFNDSAFIDGTLTVLRTEFPDDQVYVDINRNAFLIKMKDEMLAIKAPGTEWNFLAYSNDPEMAQKLLPAEVIQKFGILAK